MLVDRSFVNGTHKAEDEVLKLLIVELFQSVILLSWEVCQKLHYLGDGVVNVTLGKFLIPLAFDSIFWLSLLNLSSQVIKAQLYHLWEAPICLAQFLSCLFIVSCEIAENERYAN